MEIKKKILIGLLVAAGIYSQLNSETFVNNINEKEINKLISTLRDEKVLLASGALLSTSYDDTKKS